MAKLIKIKKLDKRNTGYGHFKYHIEVNVLKPNYHAVREWMWQTWGASKEISEWLYDWARATKNNTDMYCQNEHWAWQNDNYCKRLYLKGEEELIFFKLRWE